MVVIDWAVDSTKFVYKEWKNRRSISQLMKVLSDMKENLRKANFLLLPLYDSWIWKAGIVIPTKHISQKI
jgi:hypothetical protein